MWAFIFGLIHALRYNQGWENKLTSSGFLLVSSLTSSAVTLWRLACVANACKSPALLSDFSKTSSDIVADDSAVKLHPVSAPTSTSISCTDNSRAAFSLCKSTLKIRKTIIFAKEAKMCEFRAQNWICRGGLSRLRRTGNESAQPARPPQIHLFCPIFSNFQVPR